MFITAVSLSGFKSFAEQTELPIHDGLTVIVGPNGCGKSNIVESVRWVMGESSAKRLRGNEMSDVIFSGTSHRRRRQSAEVKITLNNQDRTAPAPFHEVEELVVSRRIERGGGSIYRINNAEVRARDVQMLFADLSIGSRSASIISQGEIADLVDSKPDGRRMLIEEAAGVRGLHSRRHESELKLAQAEANLVRLEDVMEHIAHELRELEKQARETRRYRELMAKLREYQALFWWAQDQELQAEETQLAERLSEQREAYHEAVKAGNHNTVLLSRAEADVIAARVADEEALQSLMKARDAVRGFERMHETLQAEMERDREREADWREEIERLEAEREGWMLRMNSLNEQASGGINDDGSSLEILRREFSALENEIETLKHQCQQDQLAEEAHQRELLQDEARLENVRRELQDFTQEGEGLAQKITEVQEQLSSNAEQPPAPDHAEPDWKALRDAKEELLQQAYSQFSAAREHPASLDEARAEMEQKAIALRHQEQEFLHAKKVWRQWQENQQQGLSSCWPAPKGLEKAISGALGAGFRASLEKQQGYYWLTQIPPSDTDLLEVPTFPASVRSLWQIIEELGTSFPSQWSHLKIPLSWAGFLDEQARLENLRSTLQVGQMLVCADGSGVRWDGLAWGDDVAGAAAAQWQQGATLAEQEQAVEGLRVALFKAQQEFDAQNTAWHEEFLRLEGAYRQAQSARDDAHQAWRQAEGERENRLREQQEGREKKQQLSIRLTALQQSAEALQERLLQKAEAESTLEQCLGELRAKDVDPLVMKRAEQWQDLQQRRASLHENIIAEQAVQQNLRDVEQQRIQEIAHLQQVLEKCSRRCSELERRLADLGNGRDHRVEEIAQTQKQLESTEQEWQQQDRRRQECASTLQEALRLREGLQKDQHQQALQVAQRREVMIRAEEALEHKGQARASVQELAQQATGETIERLVKIYEFATARSCLSTQQARESVENIEQRLAALGEVNLRADIDMEVKQQESERLRAESDDITEAIARLREAIAEINQQGQARLKETFRSMNTLFAEHFQRLFLGGEARLLWMDGDDPLSPGIDIQARPPGKAMQSVHLLSGGEKSLTALAMVAAVLRLCPTPICLLDEVDAALDDANVARFCALLSELSQGEKKMRFVLITHHRFSMAKADHLLGVGMPERGVSRLYAVKMEESDHLIDISAG